MSITTLPPRLQSRLPFRLAIGELPQYEQSHVQIAMRIISPRLAVPCHIVESNEHADFVLQPTAQGNGLTLSGKSRQISLERPIRIAPLADALSILIDESEAGNAHSQPTHSAHAPALGMHAEPALDANSTPLLATLLENKIPTPQEITLDNGMTLLIDERHYCAHSIFMPADLFKAVAGARVASSQALAPDEFLSRRDGRHAIQLEQLCWGCTADNQYAPSQLAHWQKAPDTTIQLHSWPNLSWQADATAWLEVFARLAQRRVGLSAFIETTHSEGIDENRARHGLSMLLAFRHARVVESGPAPSPLYPSTTYIRSTRPKGLLNRLREQLRAIAR